MKKYLTLLVISTLLLTSCNRNRPAEVVNGPETETNYSESYYEEEMDYDESGFDEGLNFEEPYDDNSYVDFKENGFADYVHWYDFETIREDSGYTIRSNMHISQWISYDNDYDTLTAAWDKVSNGNSLPDKKSMGCYYTNCFGNGQYTTFIDYDEVFYAVGYLESFNDTSGFDLSSSNPLSCGLQIGCKSTCASMMILFSNEPRLYGVDFNTFERAGNMILYSMKSNHWGPVPFVICYVIDKTPDHPIGSPSPANLNLNFDGKADFTLGSGVRPTSAYSEAAELIGDYTGSYFLSSGKEVGCDVSILDSDGILTGVFSFHNLPVNSNIVEGSYTMNVSMDDQGNYLLLGDEWLDRPEGISMIPCWVVTMEGDELTGSVEYGETDQTIRVSK